MSTQHDDTTTNVINLRWRPTIGFAARLRLVRLEYGERAGRRVTQDHIADELGVPRGTYRSWEAGNSKPQDLSAMARHIFEVTGVDPAWLLDVADDAPQRPNGGPGLLVPESTWNEACPGQVIAVDFGEQIELAGAA